MSNIEKNKIGWVSPTFSETRAVKLNPKVLAENRCLSAVADGPESDAYKILRTQLLQRTRETGGNTVMVTSALPGEGKTVTAINLAVTLAKEFSQTALLVDCDLKRQSIHHYLGINSPKGLNNYLLDDCPIKDVLVWPGIEKLSLISGGKTIQDSSELLGSQRMKDLVLEMKTRYPERYVFFDTPPILSGADALAFSSWVDHILVVVQAGVTSIKDVKRALALLPREKVLGLVLNQDQSRFESYPMKQRAS
jgi:non-specific protein-tyrosine kinase